MNGDTNESKTPEQVELDVLTLVEIWRELDFPEPTTWADDSS